MFRLFILLLLPGAISVPVWTQTGSPSCGSPKISEQPAKGSDSVIVQELQFTGVNKMPVHVVEQIAEELKRQTHQESGWLEEVANRVRDLWFEHGYFKVKVTPENRELSEDFSPKHVAAIMHVEEHEQYRLKEIEFNNNKQFSGMQVRSLFPIQINDVFNTHLIQEGLEALHKLYSTRGYINFTAVPETQVDEQARLVSLTVDIVEGWQFHIAEIKITGDDHKDIAKALQKLDIQQGEIFDPNKWKLLGAKIDTLAPGNSTERKIDEKNATVSLLIDLTVNPCGSQ